MALGLVLLGPACASAQTPGTRPFRTLASTLPQADAAQSRELRIQWVTAADPSGKSAQPVSTLTLLQQKVAPGGVRRERQPEISPNHLVIVAEDAAGRELDWRLVQNPRITRAEVPGPDGTLSGRTVEHGSVELMVTIPDVPGLDRIQIYRPVWNGREYNLEPLAQLRIGAAK